MKKSKQNPREGSTLDDFLEEEGILEEVNATVAKRVIARRLAKMMKDKRVTKATMAKRMKTSRAALDRLLDPNNQSVTLLTMNKAASALGKKLTISLDDAA